ncbi:MAG: murein L,D-transpeptidase family protein [Desulfobulbaceae bacterium]|nr:murein L,D-transpeptidase family protein [Desulfobulbaceae bacterium]
MYHCQRFLKYSFLLLFFMLNAASESSGQETPSADDRLAEVLEKVTPDLRRELAAKDLGLGSPVFIRIFKLQKKLEVWLQQNDRYRLFKTYPICSYSGYLGPKLREGDWQSPEGFYRVTPDRMNPRSSYHLSFNIGYPNDYDASLQRDGGDIMVHGGCSSKGCFAMSNHRMEEIYILAYFAFLNGQQAFDVHIFPFPVTDDNLSRFRFSPWIEFWKNLQQGFGEFEQNRRVPSISTDQGRYVIDESPLLAVSPQQQ